MRRFLALACLASALVVSSPRFAAAGGTEFPAAGTRNLGRGGTGFTRADDPTVMLRNPALLADLWEDMAYSGLHIVMPDACFQATGNNRWGGAPNDNVNFGDGPLLISAPPGSKTPDGKDLPNLLDEPYPNVCYTGPTPKLPNIAVTMKLAPGLGVGLGFFPPDIAALPQWGNRDGTVDTPDGLRASPSRWFRAHLNTSYFSALGAVGWRPTNWLSMGLGFQWQAIVYSATQFSRTDRVRAASTDVRTDVIGRDLFIPGVIASVQLTPIDALDVALGFKWSDRVKSTAKLDITTGIFGSGTPFMYVDPDGDMHSSGGAVPNRTDNRVGDVDAPPVWVPQLSVGVRFADRIAPRTPLDKWAAVHKATGRQVEDHMATERWDVEANAVAYLNGANDFSRFTNSGEMVQLQSIDGDGKRIAPVDAFVGTCLGGVQVPNCRREVPTYFHGNTQLSLRLGGDYNVMPGVLAIRAGVSWENNGQDPQYLNITNYMLGRTGLHVGATLRVADKTDISVGYVHFIQKDVKLVPNMASGSVVPPANVMQMPDKYHLVQGSNDGMAKFAIADSATIEEGPNFANAGSFYYHLDVVSIALAQHF